MSNYLRVMIAVFSVMAFGYSQIPPASKWLDVPALMAAILLGLCAVIPWSIQ